MKKCKKAEASYPLPEYGYDGMISGLTSLDPLGSYTGRTLDRDEIPVQDADDL